MNLKVYTTALCLFFVFGISPGCSPEEITKDEVLSVHANKQLGKEAAIDKLIPRIFIHSLKELKLGFDPSTKDSLLEISYGGSSALTFSSQKEYKTNTVMTHALYSAKTLFASAPYPISQIRLSLVKPLYVKDETNPDVGIQEFEILRISMDMKKAREILSKHSNVDPFSTEKSGEKERKAFLEDLIRIWKVELDELNKITVE